MSKKREKIFDIVAWISIICSIIFGLFLLIFVDEVTAQPIGIVILIWLLTFFLYKISVGRPGKGKTCIITKNQCNYTLEVESENITFQGGKSVAYFKAHYSDLGYTIIEEFHDDAT